MIRYYCPHCGSGIQAPEKLANKLAPCALCGEYAIVPRINHQRRGMPITSNDMHRARKLHVNPEKHDSQQPKKQARSYPHPRLSGASENQIKSSINQSTLDEKQKNTQFDQLILLSGAGRIKPTEFKTLAKRIESGEHVVFQD